MKPTKDISNRIVHSAGVTLVCGDGQAEAHRKMALIAKTRLAKRKQEMQTTRKENQTVTSKKHDKRCLVKPNESAIHVEPNKTVTKKESNDDLEWIKSKLKLTNELNDALLEEVKENEEAIKILKGKEKKHLEAIKSLKEKMAKIKNSKGPKIF